MAADTSKTGAPWSDDELDAIVADYFAMLAAEQRGERYVKAEHNATLRRQIKRSRGSVEYKYQNISAVLLSLGLPWIPGYKPMSRYQQAIIGAIDRYLSTHPDVLHPVPAAVPVLTDVPDIFVAPPAQIPEPDDIRSDLRRLMRKFDPVERDYRNRTLGKAGEQFVLMVERQRLTTAGRLDLAEQIRWVADVDGDGAGYDIRSFELTGRELLIEVKTTTGGISTPFFLTRTEREVSEEQPDIWRLYRVHEFNRTPRIFTIAPPLDAVLQLRAELWRASF